MSVNHTRYYIDVMVGGAGQPQVYEVSEREQDNIAASLTLLLNVRSVMKRTVITSVNYVSPIQRRCPTCNFGSYPHE